VLSDVNTTNHWIWEITVIDTVERKIEKELFLTLVQVNMYSLHYWVNIEYFSSSHRSHLFREIEAMMG